MTARDGRGPGGALRVVALGLAGSVVGAVVGYGAPAFLERTVTHQGLGGLISWAWLVALLAPVLSGLLTATLLARFGPESVSPVVVGALSVVAPAAWVARTVVLVLTMGAPVGLLLATTLAGLVLGAAAGVLAFRTSSHGPARRRSR